jgi:hypothetical protein
MALYSLCSAYSLRTSSRTVTIGDPAIAGQDAGQDIAGYFTPEEWAEAAHDDVSLGEVRRALSTMSGSLSEAVIALRQERWVAKLLSRHERPGEAVPQRERSRVHGPHP